MVSPIHNAARWRPLLIFSSLMLGVSGLAFMARSGASDEGKRCCGNAAPTESEIRLVKTVAVAPKAIADERSAIGEIRPYRESDLGFRVSGKLVSRTVNVGAVVARGDVLARVDDEDYRHRLRSAKADQIASQAVLVEAQAAEGRIRQLVEKGSATRANYDVTLKNLRSAQAKLDSANAALDLAQAQLAYTELRAEFDGVVTGVGVEEGQFVNIGQMVVRQAEPGRKDAVFSIAEAAFTKGGGASQAPQVVVSLLSNPAISSVGVVREIAPIADSATRTYRVKVALENAPAEMRLGASVAGRLEARGDPVVVLPGSALFDKNGQPAVWVVDPNSRISLKPVAIARYEIDRVIVSDGLSKGDIVVTAGVNRLREQQQVRIAEGEAK